MTRLLPKPPRHIVKLSYETREHIRHRQDCICFYCTEPILPSKFVLDHLIPRWAGGTHGPENRVAAHKRCDKVKGSRMPTELELSRLGDQIGKYPEHA